MNNQGGTSTGISEEMDPMKGYNAYNRGKQALDTANKVKNGVEKIKAIKSGGKGAGAAAKAGGAAAKAGGTAAKHAATQAATQAGTQVAAQTAGTAAGATAAGAAAGSVVPGAGNIAGAVIGAAVGVVTEGVKDPGKAMGKVAAGGLIALAPLLIVLAPILILVFIIAALLDAINPFSATNSTAGDNQMAQYQDYKKDRGKDPGSMSDQEGFEALEFYPSDDINADDGSWGDGVKDNIESQEGQYTFMANIVRDAVQEGYAISASKYYPERDSWASNPYMNTHKVADFMYLDNSDPDDPKYYENAQYVGIQYKNYYEEPGGIDYPDPGVSGELEPAGTMWDNGDYLVDMSQGGTFDSGMAYILSAYTASKCQTAPPLEASFWSNLFHLAPKQYSYWKELSDIVNGEAKNHYFEYKSQLENCESTEEINTGTLVKRYDSEFKREAGKYSCKECAGYHSDYTKVDTTDFEVSADTEYTYSLISWNSSTADWKWTPQTKYAHNGWTKAKCQDEYAKAWANATAAMYNYYGATWTTDDWNDWYDNAPDGVTSTSGYYCSRCNEFKTYSDVTATYKEWKFWYWDTDDEMTEYTYWISNLHATISPFSYQDLLERMFIDYSPFYTHIVATANYGVDNTTAGKIAAGTVINIPSGLGSVHTYMGWQCITAPSSNQYKLREQAGMKFDSEGFGKINGRYVIACTTTYGAVGDYVDFYQTDGTILKCIIGDIKNQNDSGCNKWGHNYGHCIVEFVVNKDTWYTDPMHVNPGTTRCHPEWNCNIYKAVNGGSYFDNPTFTGTPSGASTVSTADLSGGVVRTVTSPGAGGGQAGGEGSTDDTNIKGQLSEDQKAVVAECLLALEGKSRATSEYYYCAAFVGDIYEYALGYRPYSNNAGHWFCDNHTAASSDLTNIPIGAAVVATSGATPYGHIGVFVGAIYADKGDNNQYVVENVGGIVATEVNAWFEGCLQRDLAAGGHGLDCATCGTHYEPGPLGWVWPAKIKLGDATALTGVDLQAVKAQAASVKVGRGGNTNGLADYDSRAAKLAAILASDYYQYQTMYTYECGHEPAVQTACPICGEPVARNSFLWIFKTSYKFKYEKAEEPDKETITKLTDSGEWEKEEKVYSVQDKIGYFVEDLVASMPTATSKYEQGTNGRFLGSGSGMTLVEFALTQVGQNGSASWSCKGGWQDHWCAMFVSYCAEQVGLVDMNVGAYQMGNGVIPTYYECTEGAKVFNNEGLFQWAASGYTPRPGDIIFFNWDGCRNSRSFSVGFDHTAIVEKCEGGVVYTIGGNEGGHGEGRAFYTSSHVCRSQHSISSSCIMGYATPQFPEDLEGDTNAAKILNFLKKAGFNNAACAAVLANIEAESSFNPHAVGDGGTSYGICQWHNGRWNNLKNYCTQAGYDWRELSGQLHFLIYELQTSYSGVYNTLKNVPETADGAYRAAYKWCTDFEVPADKYTKADQRGQKAKNLWHPTV